MFDIKDTKAISYEKYLHNYSIRIEYLYYYIKHLRIGVSIFCHGIFYYTHFIPQLDG
jgi:hypothetical protein